jgi:transposase
MGRLDARKLKTDAQQALRDQAIQLRKAGKSNKEIANIIGVHPSTTSTWWTRFQKEGKQALSIRKRGRQPGTLRILSADQESSLIKLIIDKRPDEFKLLFALWDRKTVQRLLKLQYGIDMPIRTVSEYLKRWGFTSQKPIHRAYEQSPAKVKKWLDEDYPTLAKRAKTEKAEIHWVDKTGLRFDMQHGRGYRPKSQMPMQALPLKCSNINMICSITNQGKVRFMLYRDAMNYTTLIRFLKRLIKDAKRKVFLIIDNLRLHHAKKARAWLAEHTEDIEIFYLPSCSPKLNPDEYLNCNSKYGLYSSVLAKTREQLAEKTI